MLQLKKEEKLKALVDKIPQQDSRLRGEKNNGRLENI